MEEPNESSEVSAGLYTENVCVDAHGAASEKDKRN
jgi:hypothetical protein